MFPYMTKYVERCQTSINTVKQKHSNSRIPKMCVAPYLGMVRVLRYTGTPVYFFPERWGMGGYIKNVYTNIYTKNIDSLIYQLREHKSIIETFGNLSIHATCVV